MGSWRMGSWWMSCWRIVGWWMSRNKIVSVIHFVRQQLIQILIVLRRRHVLVLGLCRSLGRNPRTIWQIWKRSEKGRGDPPAGGRVARIAVEHCNHGKKKG